MASADLVIKARNNGAALIMSSMALILAGAAFGMQACPPVPAPAAASVKPAEGKPIAPAPVVSAAPSVVLVPIDPPPVVAAPVVANATPVAP
jgi:hypothetical protein